ncbi:MAG TPA: 3'-5' exonuclease, partial [Desulfitobacteriaceae bacterium]|nr:3'-5' exonuclease [Desulfitobacteriaceae bacterium]
KSNLVEFANRFLEAIPQRLKKTPIIAVQPDKGKVKLVHYQSSNLIMPLIDDILSEGLAGTTCVLTKTNEEALQVTGLLLKNGLQAKLIQSNEEFNLSNLLEIRYFLSLLNLTEDIYMISDEIWAKAKRELKARFGSSLNLELCLNLISDFEAVNPRNKYKSDLDIFIRESKLEDFFAENSETIFVSTIHKAKGREFDNVFLLLVQFNSRTNEAKRQLYVAMTRAKRNLNLHYNGNYPDFLKSEDVILINDSQTYAPPGQLAMQLTYKDVWLDSFLSRQNLISQLNSGDILTIDGTCCRNSKRQAVLRFSRQFMKQIESMKQKQYLPKTAKIRFIVYWRKENSEQEIRIILPELYFERRDAAFLETPNVMIGSD